MPKTLISLAELDDERRAYDAAGARVAFVPTMGALHAGHASLVQLARQQADRVLVSIFVNPTQFGPSEDFSRYPRTLAADLEVLAGVGADAVFVPNAATIYPDGFQTYVHNKGIAAELEGKIRPGHFEGVLTVVLKLFNLTRPHVAVFGKKDYQQWRLIARMVDDLRLPLTVVGAETMRESDGLAMSSRNRYLTPAERPTAGLIAKGLAAAKAAAAGGGKTVEALRAAFLEVVAMAMASGDFVLEYAEVRRRTDLAPLGAGPVAPEGAVMLVAGKVGTTRLIDNMELG